MQHSNNINTKYTFSLHNLIRYFEMMKFLVNLIIVLFMLAISSCGSYQKSGNQTGKFMMGMDKDRTHRYEEGQQRRIDEDKQKRIEIDRNGNSKTGSIRYFIY